MDVAVHAHLALGYLLIHRRGAWRILACPPYPTILGQRSGSYAQASHVVQVGCMWQSCISIERPVARIETFARSEPATLFDAGYWLACWLAELRTVFNGLKTPAMGLRETLARSLRWVGGWLAGMAGQS